MREEKDIRILAAQLKVAMEGRAREILLHATVLANKDAGLADVGEDRANTMRDVLHKLRRRQHSDGMQLAVLRWVLGITEEVEPNNLELNK